ncbi:MAG: DUF4956 domain-containing protein [Clostridiales bacterium]|nr:DUF4956 domain-containing protein [Clostridiales bacterium]
MTFKDMIKKSVLEGFSGNNISIAQIVTVLAVTTLLACYIFLIYYISTKKTFYNKSFNISLALIAVITASIILAMQSNLVISLGMVGALSIIRFRTAVKDPKDLVFLFWAISTGIICGAGMFEIAVIAGLILTIGLFALELTPIGMASMLLVVNAASLSCEEEVLQTIGRVTKHYSVKSRNTSGGKTDFIVELKVKDQSALIKAVSEVKDVTGVSLISRDGEVNF